MYSPVKRTNSSYPICFSTLFQARSAYSFPVIIRAFIFFTRKFIFSSSSNSSLEGLSSSRRNHSRTIFKLICVHRNANFLLFLKFVWFFLCLAPRKNHLRYFIGNGPQKIVFLPVPFRRDQAHHKLEWWLLLSALSAAASAVVVRFVLLPAP